MSIREANSSRVLQQGSDYSDRVKNNLISLLNKNFSSNPSYYEVKINEDASLIGVQITDNTSNQSEKLHNLKKVIMQPNEVLNVGDIINWNEDKWLCMSSEMFSDIYYRGAIQKCNNTLKFYDKNCILYTIPCIFSDASIDMEDGRFMRLPSSHYNVTIPDTGVIKKSDLDLRFILNDAPYKIEGISNATNGLIKIELVDDVFSDSDNKELGIADYYDNQGDYVVQILNGEEVTLYGGDSSTLQLNVQCKKNGEIVENPDVTYTSSNLNTCDINSTGLITIKGTGTSIVTVTYGTATDTININSLMSVPDNFEVVLTPSDTTIYVNRTKTFTANIANNGIDMPYYGVDWTVVNVDGTNNKYCAYTIDERNVTITAKNFINKQIKIKASLSNDSSIYSEKIITFESLL